jgi:osmotically-inducible protein OsmY
MTTAPQRRNLTRRSLALGGLVALAGGLSGCAPLLVGGAVVGGTLMAADRRTSGAQIEDQAIELKTVNRLRDAIGDRGHVSVTSYNRTVLVTGEVPTEADRIACEQAVSRTENVRAVVNELAVMGNSSLASRSSDTIITSKVKAAFLDGRDIYANHFKVVTERGTVYLLGLVTEREANRATEIARGVGGVLKVVRVFEIVTEADIADRAPKR